MAQIIPKGLNKRGQHTFLIRATVTATVAAMGTDSERQKSMTSTMTWTAPQETSESEALKLVEKQAKLFEKRIEKRFQDFIALGLKNTELLSENSYRITACSGYDNRGRQIKKRKTVTLPELVDDKRLKWTAKQKQEYLDKQRVLFEEEVAKGIYLNGETMTFAAFTQKWLDEYAEKQLAPGTLKNYRMRIQKRTLPALGHLKIAKIQPHHLMTFYNNLGEDGIRLDGKFKPSEKVIETLAAYPTQKLGDMTGISFKTIQRLKKGEPTGLPTAEKLCNALELNVKNSFTACGEKKLSDKTIREHHNIVSAILATAVKWNTILANPAERVDIGKPTKYTAKYYDDKQLSAMFAALSVEPFMQKCMVYVSVDLGIRQGELIAIRWSDIDFISGKVTINKQRQYISGFGEITKAPKTDSGTRYITLSATVNKMLRRLQAQQQGEFEVVGETWSTDCLIFTHEDGTAIHTTYPYKWFTAFLERHGLPKITYHQLRHTNASLSIAAGVDVVTLSGRLGHADKNVTLGTYSHMIQSREEQVANAMDKYYSSVDMVKKSDTDEPPQIRKAV